MIRSARGVTKCRTYPSPHPLTRPTPHATLPPYHPPEHPMPRKHTPSSSLANRPVWQGKDSTLSGGTNTKIVLMHTWTPEQIHSNSQEIMRFCDGLPAELRKHLHEIGLGKIQAGFKAATLTQPTPLRHRGAEALARQGARACARLGMKVCAQAPIISIRTSPEDFGL